MVANEQKTKRVNGMIASTAEQQPWCPTSRREENIQCRRTQSSVHTLTHTLNEVQQMYPHVRLIYFHFLMFLFEASVLLTALKRLEVVIYIDLLVSASTPWVSLHEAVRGSGLSHG